MKFNLDELDNVSDGLFGRWWVHINSENFVGGGGP